MMVDKNAFLVRLLATVIILAVFIFLFVKDWSAESKKNIKAGCYYKQVQCIQAPCDPILVCPNE